MDTTHDTSRPLDEHEARVAELIGRYFEDDLEGTEAVELADLLRDDAAAREQFVSFSLGRSLVGRVLGADRAAGATRHAARAAARPTVIGRIGAVVRSPLAQAAVLAVAVTVFIAVISNVDNGPATETARPRPAEPTAYAVISDVRDAAWSGEAAASDEPQVGAQLNGGTVELANGATQMVFASGAVVDVLGPAEFRVVGPKRGYLKSGRVLVWVPKDAHGFTITTDSGDVVDLGTEFGVSVDDATGAAEVHVIQGHVRAELRTKSGAPRVTQLTASQALRMDAAAQTAEPVAIDTERFGRTLGPTLEEEAATGPGVSVNFDDYTIKPYGKMGDGWQDGQHGLPTSFAVLDNGRTLKLSGNAWKMIDLPYTITKRTIVSFDFRSTSEGQIHGFGFDDDVVFDREHGDPAMQVFGVETWPRINRMYWNYRPDADWKHYVIPIGELRQGAAKLLYFINDDDIDGNADSYFRNVRVYESAASAGATDADPGTARGADTFTGKGAK
ncbi:MAG: hypothetical protein GC159_07125 [Phycisphaera sp.]|nr:hypothetical protein [Phycisphaera sp.]